MDGRRRLAELFGAWADRHGLTQGEIAAMGGPSTTTQTKVRHTDGPISRQTLRRLDAVMGWPNGTAAGILQGEHPPGVPDLDSETVGPSGDTEDHLLFARPDGLTDEEWETAKANAGELVRWVFEKARERPMQQR